ncbi:unnamed protein product, partial [marine sediment metagenome]
CAIVPPMNIVPIGSNNAASSTHLGNFLRKMQATIPTTIAPEIPPWKACTVPMPSENRNIAIPKAETHEKAKPIKTPVMALTKWANGLILVPNNKK